MQIPTRRAAYFLFVMLTLAAAIALFAQLRAKPTPPAALRIGAHFELSGKYAVYGTAALAGAQMAVQEINAAGGLLGRPLELVWRDNRSDEVGSRQAFLDLVQTDRVAAVIGPNISSCAIAIAPLAEQLHMPLVISWASNPRITLDDSGRTRAYVFRACYVDTFQGSVTARFARSSLQLNRIAVLFDDSSPYAQGLRSFFEESFRQLGGQISASIGYQPTAAHWLPQLNAALRSEPDALFIAGYQAEMSKLIIQARSLGFAGPIVISDAWDDNERSSVQPVDPFSRIYHTTQFSLLDPDPAVQRFAVAYAAFSGAAPLQTSALAYDSTHLLADAIRRADSSNPQAIRLALEQTAAYPGISGNIQFNERHNAEKSMVFVAIEQGRAVFF